MKTRRLPAALLAAVISWTLLGFAVTAHADDLPFVERPVEHVTTLIGTGTGGEEAGEIDNFPGAAVPFGMVQYSPDTTDTYAGYDHDNDRSTGFSMNHASAGCATFGDIPVLPTTTPIGSQPWYAWERIAHDDTEVGVPGYYAVRFPETGVSAELTATPHTGAGRFRYPDNGRPALFHVRSGGSLAGNSAATVRIGEDGTTVTGSATSGGFCGAKNTYTVYFVMTFSRPFTAYGTWQGNSVTPGARSAASPRSGAYLQFPAGSVLEVRTAISYVSVEGARANLAAEGGVGFDEVRAAASSEWNTELSRIKVAGTSSGDMETFYTSLYRTMLHPNTFNDVDGRYTGFDGAVHTVAQGHTQYANFSDWDTYRCLAALQALLFPDRAGDMAQSLVHDAEQSGSFPRWALANSSTAIMTGDNPVPLIVNLFTFGGRSFDAKKALYYMLKAATDGGAGLDDYVERPGIASYLSHGYAPQTAEFGAGHAIAGASITLEWSLDDFTIARFAESLGDSVIAAHFQDRAQWWHHLFNPATGYISPRDAAGAFVNGPALQDVGSGVGQDDFGQEGFDEGNADQYLWLVPQNVGGLISALGGRQAAAERLDRFTTQLNAGPNKPYLWIGNEPDFGVPWLYNYMGQPWKTQQTVDRVRSQLFGPRPDGEPGNDDLGAMSSWYVWAALGLYPITPGTPILTVNTPLFDRVEISLPAGESIRISAPGAASGLKYINGLDIDGRPTDQTYLPEAIIRDGGDLSFSLSPIPNPFWGSAGSAAPPSFTAGLGR
jgi:predicted alpha-1,2-mannosidase